MGLRDGPFSAGVTSAPHRDPSRLRCDGGRFKRPTFFRFSNFNNPRKWRGEARRAWPSKPQVSKSKASGGAGGGGRRFPVTRRAGAWLCADPIAGQLEDQTKPTHPRPNIITVVLDPRKNGDNEKFEGATQKIVPLSWHGRVSFLNPSLWMDGRLAGGGGGHVR